MAAAIILALTLGLAFANGANDVSKGIATLVGSGVTDYKRAVLWGTLWTVAGGVLASFLASELAATFSGRGLLATAPEGQVFLVAVASGAIGWLVIATLTGLPVSTTHALVGGLVGAGIAAEGFGGVLWAAVAKKVAFPLTVSPALALAFMAATLPVIRLAFRRLNAYCVCVERRELVLAAAGGPAPASGTRSLAVVAGADCPSQVDSRLNAMDSLHWLSAGLTSLFRGLNDAPKILAIGVVAASASGVSSQSFYVLVALAMGAGSYVAGSRVTATLAGKVTRMSPDDGFAANLVTSVLVGVASQLSLPVSTTHVSSSAVIGVGLRRGDVRWIMVRDMALAWLVTLPVAGLVAAAAYVLPPLVRGAS